jgi:aspartate 1-decarboxylase
MCKSKVHHAVVTEANIDYEGSISIDRKIMDAANLLPYERVQVANLRDGQRLETYVIEAPGGSGTIGMNGAAAHLVKKGDIIHIISYALMNDQEARELNAIVVHLNSRNEVDRISRDQYGRLTQSPQPL